jgi:hypothetical protein
LHRAASMAERRSSGGGARARRSGRGRVFIDAGGRLGGPEGNHVAGAHAAWATRRDDVRRTSGPMASGGWHAGEWTTAPWHRPSAHRRHAVVLRCGTWTDGSSGASACARGARTASWRGARVTLRESALWRRGVKNSLLMPCSKSIFFGFLN